MFSLFVLATVAICYAGTVAQGTFQFPRIGCLSDMAKAIANSRAQLGEHSLLECEAGIRDCEDIFLQDRQASDGVYTVCPEGDMFLPVEVQCDMEDDGWTVLLNRYDGSTDFDDRLTWDQMKKLVGNLTQEFWLGLEPVHRFTTPGDYSLKIEIAQRENTWTEFYNKFYLESEEQDYTLKLEDFNNAESTVSIGSLDDVKNLPFATRDHYPDSYREPCAAFQKGPYWYNHVCYPETKMFSPYTNSPGSDARMLWYVSDIGYKYLTKLTLKIRRRRM